MSSASASTGSPSTPLSEALAALGQAEAVERVAGEPVGEVAAALAALRPAQADAILWALPEARRQAILRAAPPEWAAQWRVNHGFAADRVGRLMEPALARLPPDATVAEAIEALRPIVGRAFVTYAWVVDAADRLLGVLVFRDLLFAAREARVAEVMVKEPFSLKPDQELTDAMRAALRWHLPVYPVCAADGRLIGMLRGQSLFEHQAFELTAQAGTMVGVEKEERLSTGWPRSLRFRHPWLQLNLLTAFVAAAVVGFFQSTLDRLVVLAVFLPVLAGQSGNTGCQALAVSLRGITLGEFRRERTRAVLGKEALLGAINGSLVGLTAGLGMYLYARSQGNPAALTLGLVVLAAMACSCTVSGIAGVLIPVALRRVGADPATASSIFLTTATDVVSMGTFLGLATWVVR